MHLTECAKLQINGGMNDLLTPVDIEKLAAENGRSIPEVCRNAAVAASTFSRWKAGKTTPSIEVYRRIRDAAAQPRLVTQKTPEASGVSA